MKRLNPEEFGAFDVSDGNGGYDVDKLQRVLEEKVGALSSDNQALSDCIKEQRYYFLLAVAALADVIIYIILYGFLKEAPKVLGHCVVLGEAICFLAIAEKHGMEHVSKWARVIFCILEIPVDKLSDILKKDGD